MTLTSQRLKEISDKYTSFDVLPNGPQWLAAIKSDVLDLLAAVENHVCVPRVADLSAELHRLQKIEAACIDWCDWRNDKFAGKEICREDAKLFYALCDLIAWKDVKCLHKP